MAMSILLCSVILLQETTAESFPEIGPGTHWAHWPIWAWDPLGPLAQLGLGPVGPIPVGPGTCWAHWPSWAWDPLGPFGPVGPRTRLGPLAHILQVYRHPTGRQTSYRYTGILQVYSYPTGLQAPCRSTAIPYTKTFRGVRLYQNPYTDTK